MYFLNHLLYWSLCRCWKHSPTLCCMRRKCTVLSSMFFIYTIICINVVTSLHIFMLCYFTIFICSGSDFDFQGCQSECWKCEWVCTQCLLCYFWFVSKSIVIFTWNIYFNNTLTCVTWIQVSVMIEPIYCPQVSNFLCLFERYLHVILTLCDICLNLDDQPPLKSC